MKNSFLKNKIIKNVIIAGLLASMCISPSWGNAVSAQEVISDVPQDITAPTTKTYILSESEDSVWIPVSVAKKGFITFDCKATGNGRSLYMGLYRKKDVTSEREFSIIFREGYCEYSVTTPGVIYIFIEKNVDDRGKEIRFDMTTTFYEQYTPEKIEQGKTYDLIQSGINVYEFVLSKPQKVTFNMEDGVADILDYKKDVCCELEYSDSAYLDKGTYYLRVWGMGKKTISFSGKNVSVKDATNVKKDKAIKLKLAKPGNVDNSIYLNYKKNKNRELWYKIKSSEEREVLFTCSYDSQSTSDYVRSITTYDSKGKKEKTDGNIITLKKGINYVKVTLIKEAVSGILKTTISSGIYFNYDTKVSEMVSVENSASVYAKDVINSTYAVKSYSDYSKLLKKVEKKYLAEYKGFNIECDEFYATLKRYDKNFFKKNNLYIFSYDVPESGQITLGAKLSINKSEGSMVLTADRFSLASGVNRPAVSYYLASVKKSAVKGISEIIAAEQPVAMSEESEEDKLFAKWVTPVYTPDEYTDNTIKYTGMMLDFDAKWLYGKKVISTYNQYKKFILNSTEEIPECLKGFKKSYFKKNNLIFYTYGAADSGRNARGAYITKENIDGVNTLVCSFVGLPYYGSGFDSYEHYCYAVQISKKETAKAKQFKGRHVAMRNRTK